MRYFNSKGESLISVLVAVGIMAVIMTASSYMFANLMKIQKTVNVRGTMESVLGEIRMALGADQVCKLNLQGVTVPAPETTGTVSITSLKYLNAAGTALGTKVIAASGAHPSGIEINRMDISDTKVASVGVLIGKLSITMKGSGVIGVDTFTRSIPIQLTVNATNVIQDCKSVTQSGDVSITVTTTTAPTTPTGKCPSGVVCAYPGGGLFSNCGTIVGCHGGIPSHYRYNLPEGFPTQVRTASPMVGYGTLTFTCGNGAWGVAACASGGDGDGAF